MKEYEIKKCSTCGREMYCVIPNEKRCGLCARKEWLKKIAK